MSQETQFVVRCVGKITEVIGPVGEDKNKILSGLIRRTQASGGIAAFIDTRQSIDTKSLEDGGVNLQELLVSQPKDMEEYVKIMNSLVASQAVDLLLVDIVGKPHFVWDSPTFAYMNFGPPQAESHSVAAVSQGFA